MTHKAYGVGIALLCLAFGSEALTLGRIRGAALLGQPLNMVVPVQMDAGEDVSSLCFEAEVFHADTRQDVSRVRVLVEAVGQTQAVNVRVLSSAVVDEPVVTIYLRSSCGQQTARRYVLLADLPNQAAAGSLATNSLPVSALSPAQVVAVPASASGSSAVSNSPPVAPASVLKAKPVRPAGSRQHPEGTAVVAAPLSRPSGDTRPTGRAAGRARLQLDPLELFSDRVANLDSYMTFPASEDALRSMQKVQALEASVKILLASATRNEVNLVDMRARLRQAESARYPGGLVYGLIAMVLACLAAVAFLWHRQRRVPVTDDDWWRSSIAMPASPSAGAYPGPAPEPELSPVEMSELDFDHFMLSGVTPSARPSLSSPAVASPSVAPDASAQTGRPYVLDLDLSDPPVETYAAHPVSVAAVDIPLPMLDEHELAVPDAETRRLVDLGNLMEFDLPASLPPPVLAK